MGSAGNAIVTGGSRGIGRAICIELAQHGFYVVVNYKTNDAAAEETLALIRASGGEGELARFDVADGGETASRLAEIVKRLKSVDALVNNAGVAADGLFALMPEADWQKVLNTTLGGFFNVTKPVVKAMLVKRRGSIVSLSSVSARLPNRGQTNYSAAKAGLIGASRALAAEISSRNIRVNVVAPGIIGTDMTKDVPLDQVLPLIPMRRIGAPEEVAKVVRFLCSDDASYITGQVISVNGGMI